MNIEQQIYNVLLNNAKGVQADIKGLTQPTLIAMKRGDSKTSFSKLFNILFDNGILKLTLESEHTQMVFYCEDKEVVIQTKSLTTKDK